MSDDEENFHDFYALLGVAYEATLGEIKNAYYSMSKRYHPDLNPDDQTESTIRFRIVKEAYDVLSDPAKRGSYNREWQKFRDFEDPDVANEYFGQVSQNDWEFACRYFSALKKCSERLAKISSAVELRWRNRIFFEKAFSQAEEFASAAEDAYLGQVVGESVELRKVMRDALLVGHEGLTLELAVALRVLGLPATEASISQICENVLKSSPPTKRYEKAQATPEHEILREEIYAYRGSQEDTVFIEIKRDLWCRVKEKTNVLVNPKKKIYESSIEYWDGEFPYIFSAISKIERGRYSY